MARPKDFILDSAIKTLRKSGDVHHAEIIASLVRDNDRLRKLVDSLTESANNADVARKTAERDLGRMRATTTKMATVLGNL